LLCLLAAALLLSAASVAEARAPVRSIETIAWAIGVDHKHVSVEQRRFYARVLREVARKHQFDPLTGVALVWHESRWRPGATGDSGEAIGLAQIHYRHLCKGAEACDRMRRSLHDPAYNIRVMGQLIAGKRAWCRKQTGKPALFARWLHAYGFNQRKNLKCNMKRTRSGWKDQTVPREIQRIIRYRLRLIKQLKRKRFRRRRARS